MTHDFTTLYSERVRLYGDGRDGSATVSGGVSITMDKAYQNLTITGSGYIQTLGYKIYVLDVLDFSGGNGSNDQIQSFGYGGKFASGTTGGVNDDTTTPPLNYGQGGLGKTLTSGVTGANGKDGTSGTGATGTASVNDTYGAGGGGGAGGTGAPGTTS